MITLELNCHSHKNFSEYLMAIEMKKTKIKMIKPIYLGMSILDIKHFSMNFAYLIDRYDDDDYEKNKKAKGTKECVIRRRFMFENFKDCLFKGEIIRKSQQRLKSGHHKVYTEEGNKIALSNNDDKRLQIDEMLKGENVYKMKNVKVNIK